MAEINDHFVLVHRRKHSFATDNPTALCAWLVDQGFILMGTTTQPHMMGRLEKEGQIVLVYKTGTISVGGKQEEQAIKLLKQACKEHPSLSHHLYISYKRRKRLAKGVIWAMRPIPNAASNEG